MARDAPGRAGHGRREELRRRIAQLTPAQRDVMDLIVAGKPNKVIAGLLTASVRPVETRRREVFKKTQADSLAELVQMVIHAGPDE